MRHTIIPNLFRMPALKARPAGGTHRGIPKAVSMAGLHMSHNGKHWVSPNCAETVQARQGQHQKP